MKIKLTYHSDGLPRIFPSVKDACEVIEIYRSIKFRPHTLAMLRVMVKQYATAEKVDHSVKWIEI